MLLTSVNGESSSGLSQAPVDRYPSSSVDTLSDPDTKASSSTLSSPSIFNSIFVPRENPRQFFIRDSLPSTESSVTPSGSASLAATPKDSFEEQATSRDANERRAFPAANGTASGKAKQAEASMSAQHSGGQVVSLHAKLDLIMKGSLWPLLAV